MGVINSAENADRKNGDTHSVGVYIGLVSVHASPLPKQRLQAPAANHAQIVKHVTAQSGPIRVYVGRES